MCDLQPVRLCDIRVDRSTLQRTLSSSKMDGAFRTFVSVWIVLGFVYRDKVGLTAAFHFCPRCRTIISRAAAHPYIGNFQLSCYVSDCSVHSRSSVGLRESSLRHHLRSPRPQTFSDVQGVACRIGHRGIHRRSCRHPQRIILATPLKRTAPNLLPRRVRSACRAHLRGGQRRFFCLVFFALKSRRCEPRSIFPFAKVGLTAHRKTSRGFG